MTLPSNPIAAVPGSDSSTHPSTHPLPSDFVGLSYETEQVLPNPSGGHYFSPSNTSLITLFKTLGIRHLRIGGNSVDRPVTAIPDARDIDELFGFARAAGVRVIYSVRLQDGDAMTAAQTVKHIDAHYRDLIDVYAIGNEPAYYKPYESCREKWRPIMQAIIDIVPQARFCGPDTNPEPTWCRSMVEDFGAPRGPLSMLTVHNYPGDCSYTNPGAKTVEELIPKDAAAARQEMLSGAWESVYAKVHKGMADAVAGTTLPFRLAETNNFWYGGLAGASDTFAAALWSVEYLFWWATHGAAGINFHTGDRVGGGSTSLTSRYTAFVTTPSGYDVRPLSYGLKLFTLAAGDFIRGGTVSPLTLNGNPSRLRAFTTTNGSTTTFTIINKSHGPNAAAATIDLPLPATTVRKARSIAMRQSENDVAAKTGLTIGGKAIEPNGAWHGQWQPLNVATAPLQVVVPAACAMVIAVDHA